MQHNNQHDYREYFPCTKHGTVKYSDGTLITILFWRYLQENNGIFVIYNNALFKPCNYIMHNRCSYLTISITLHAKLSDYDYRYSSGACYNTMGFGSLFIPLSNTKTFKSYTKIKISTKHKNKPQI